MSIVKGICPQKSTSEATIGEQNLATLFKEYYDRLVYFSRQIVKDDFKAQDIAQDAFIKYWQQKESISGERLAIKNFLYSTVKNASLNVIRHDKVVERYSAANEMSEIDESTIMEAMINTEVIAEIHSALHALPENYRIISMMGYFDGKKNHEIANELEMSVNTVKKQKQKAIQLLRLKLSADLFLFFNALFILATAHRR